MKYKIASYKKGDYMIKTTGASIVGELTSDKLDHGWCQHVVSSDDYLLHLWAEKK